MASRENGGRRPGRPSGRGAVLGLGLLSIISNLLLLTGPLFMLQIYDRVLASKSVPTLMALTGLVIGLYGFYSVIEIVRSRMATRYSVLAAARLTRPVFAQVVASSASSRRGTEGDPIRDAETLRQFLAGAGPMALLDLPWVPIYLFIVFAFHPMLGWLALAGAGVVSVLMILNEWSSRGPSRDANAAANARQSQHSDLATNAEAVLAMGMRETLADRWEAANTKMLMTQARAADRATIFSALTKGFRLLLQSGVLAMGAYLAIGGEISAGLMIAASIVTARALSPVEQAVANWRGFVAARQAKARLKTVLAEAKGKPERVALPLPKSSLGVSDLAISPLPDGPALVCGVNFELKSGEAMGVLGTSGCGKSSLIRTLMGIWPARSGVVRLDGSELSHYDPDRLGMALGYLPQTVELFAGTVAQNIARFRSDGEFEDVLKAAEAAGVHELIASLPHGYDTPIGPQGAMLSAGQRQRIGLARALYGDPFLIVLDEPNSNLDAAGDAACNAAIAGAKARGAIMVIVAHRPTAIAAVDTILFLQDGRQAAFGPKDAVLASITAQPASLDIARKARRK
ncbi:type I secretion system permease/ATPase [Pelagibacterium halotolerans]|uniref:type I secretion system permease/ATPase n=1 Tax=Pelagibacterium halotolerans TaxID=531813 RepID=UPI0002D54B5F|nr:type I secretion system permease/ATPase [Pelagibacterium halotolerans]QJR17712.1 type I secretion system permease/ATPase [Pelagibacterium halotolerans]SEA40446.1 type I secretion system ABC transporter, PrtD family [Pelagibacterium halotolerans]